MKAKMYYYKCVNEKTNVCSYSCSNVAITDERFEQITKAEYDKATSPSEEEIRQEKECQLRRLMAELYPADDI